MRATGSWNLAGGTIQGGRVDESDGSVLALTSSWRHTLGRDDQRERGRNAAERLHR